MKKLLIFVLAVVLLAPMSINATESDETEEAIEALPDDGTGTWVAIGPQGGKIYTLAIDPSDTNIVYAGGDGGVFKSTNSGGSWSVSGLDRLTVHFLAISPARPDKLYASTPGGSYSSTDKGAHWTMGPLGVIYGGSVGDDYALAVDPRSSAVYYSCTCTTRVHSHFVTYIGGNLYDRYDFLNNTFVDAIAVDPSNSDTVYLGTYGGGVYKSTDGTNNFTQMPSGLSGLSLNVFALVIDRLNTNIIYAGTDTGVFKSKDGGESWKSSGLANTHITVLAINPSDPSTIYAGTDGGVFESTDGGENWSVINSGLTNTHVTSLAIDPSNPDIIYAGTDGGGVFKLTSSGGPPTLHVTKSGTGNGTVTSNPPGINCGSECKANFADGTIVTLTASADAASTFTGWSGGGCSGTDPCTITLNSNTTIEASFALSESCAYTISPTNKTFNANGGNLSVNVSATGQANCPAPLVAEDVEWISVSGTPTWKANKGTVKLAVQKNPMSHSRTGIVSIGGQTLTIKEDGAKCQLTALSPPRESIPVQVAGGSFDITVSPRDCCWNVATTSGWIHLDTTTGTGNGTATFHMDANSTGKNRTGKIDVSLAQDATKKKTFTVNESK